MDGPLGSHLCREVLSFGCVRVLVRGVRERERGEAVCLIFLPSNVLISLEMACNRTS